MVPSWVILIIILTSAIFIIGAYFYTKNLNEHLEISKNNNKLLADNYTKSENKRRDLEVENKELRDNLRRLDADNTKVVPTPIIKYVNRNIIDLEVCHTVDLYQIDRVVTEDEIEAHLKQELADKAKEFVLIRKCIDPELGQALYKAKLSVAGRDCV